MGRGPDVPTRSCKLSIPSGGPFCHPATFPSRRGLAEPGISTLNDTEEYGSRGHPSARTVVGTTYADATLSGRSLRPLPPLPRQSNPSANCDTALVRPTPFGFALDHAVSSPDDAGQILRSRTPVWPCCLLRTPTGRSPRAPSSNRPVPFPDRAPPPGGVPASTCFLASGR